MVDSIHKFQFVSWNNLSWLFIKDPNEPFTIQRLFGCDVTEPFNLVYKVQTIYIPDEGQALHKQKCAR